MLKQDTRLLGLTTALEDTELALTSFHGHEEISQLFQFRLELISDNNDIRPAQLVGTNVTFRVAREGEDHRYFNGFVSWLARGDQDREGRRNYSAEVVPWLWFLTRRTDCRIFQKKTAPEIVAHVFQQLGFNDFDMTRVKGEYRRREYCIQYRETDLNFVTRLLEEEGIYFQFRHENGSHILELADQSCGHPWCTEQSVDFPHDRGSQLTRDRLTDWQRRHEFRSGRWTQTHYDFAAPDANLETCEQSVVQIPEQGKYELYDYPGLYTSVPEGRQLARRRIEEQEVSHDVARAASTCLSLSPGRQFRVGAHRSANESNQVFLVTSIDHAAAETQAYETANGSNAGSGYSNRLTCIPAGVPFRPRRRASKPTVHGLQTARVVAPGENEINTEKHGQVRVRFHWDRQPDRNGEDTCWMRVAQVSAGNGWGAHFWPREGHEVVVAFLEGDPDQPLIIGSVYNARNLPPYDLPEHQTRSGIKTRSTPEGGPDHFNELRFEDRKGKEEVYLHAERQLKTVVESHESRSVGHSRSTTVGKDDKLNVGAHRTADIGAGAQAATSDIVDELAVHGKRNTMINGEDDLFVEGTAGAVSRLVRVQFGNDMLNVVDGDSATMLDNGNRYVTALNGDIVALAPLGTHGVTADKATVLASTELTLMCGASMIRMTPGAIEIKAPMVLIN